LIIMIMFVWLKGNDVRLSQCKIHQGGVISRVEATGELRHRFYTLGIAKGNPVRIDAFSTDGKTMKITINRTSVALRSEEAEQIFVEPAA